MTTMGQDGEPGGRLTMPQLLDACGRAVNARTVRFWIKEGLLDPPAGGRGVHARYGPGHVERIAEIRRLQDLGLSLANIGLLVRAPQPDPGPPTEATPSPDAPDATPPPDPVPFWQRPPRSLEQPVPLAAGVRLLLDRTVHPSLDEHAVEAVRRAAAPLLALLATLQQPSTSARPSPLPAPVTDHAGAVDDAAKDLPDVH